MHGSDEHYVHGTEDWEQRRLSTLNALLNASSLRAMALSGGERVLDVGCGLGQFTRMIGRQVGPRGRVVGVERDPEQRAEAERQAREDGEAQLFELRAGSALELPLADDEWGSFDVAHTRFLLEHVTDPLAVLRQMLRAVRPGGRIVVEDDDHETLRLWPEPPGVAEIWRAYYETYTRQGKNPLVGRHLVSLLHQAGARPRRNLTPFFGTCAGSPDFEAMVDNFAGVIDGARGEIVGFGLAEEKRIDAALDELQQWKTNGDAALWYTTCWAEAVRPGRDAAARLATAVETRPAVAEISMDPEGSTILRFLMRSAAELSSSLELEEVYTKIADGLRPLIDYHLFCVMLWNESTQVLENSFSTKYGEAIRQKGGFPLGYGISGSAAQLRRPVRVADVRDDPRYVRFRHPEVEIRSELCVPLLFGDQLIGVVDLESTEPNYFTLQHEQMVAALASNIATAIVNARMHARVRRGEQRYEQELATAREIQRGLLPNEAPSIDGLELGSAYSPARELGGDFYDFLRYPDGRLGFVVGDAAGKATPAALFASMAVGMLRGHVMEQGEDPAAMLGELNDELEAAAPEGRFVAMALAVYDPTSRSLALANAGLPHVLRLRDGSLDRLPIDGIPLGMLPDRHYPLTDIELRAGDLLLVSTDGITEAENARGESFGDRALGDALRQLASRPPAEIAERICLAAVEFAGGPDRQRDDYTLVVARAG